jgi:branched-chain amino acid transport system substrate-binding protein
MISTNKCMTAAIVFSTIAIVADFAKAEKKYGPGVTDTEIKVGQTMPYSGPASAWGTVGRAELAYFKMINDQGGINGRKINLISLDDAFSPPRPSSSTPHASSSSSALAPCTTGVSKPSVNPSRRSAREDQALRCVALVAPEAGEAGGGAQLQ